MLTQLDLARAFIQGKQWLIWGDSVFDVQAYLDRHPGGRHIINAYLGLDATDLFSRVNGHGTLGAVRQMSSLLVGNYVPQRDGWQSSVCEVIKKIILMANITRMQAEVSFANVATILEVAHARMQLKHEHVPAVVQGLTQLADERDLLASQRGFAAQLARRFNAAQPDAFFQRDGTDERQAWQRVRALAQLDEERVRELLAAALHLADAEPAGQVEAYGAVLRCCEGFLEQA